MFILLLGSMLAAATPVDTVVVCPAEFRPALKPWVEYRTAQGHAIAFVDPTGTAEAIAERVRQQAKTPGVRFVVLVGDAEPHANAPAAARARCVPTHVAKAKVNIHWGSEPTLITDNAYRPASTPPRLGVTPTPFPFGVHTISVLPHAPRVFRVSGVSFGLAVLSISLPVPSFSRKGDSRTSVGPGQRDREEAGQSTVQRTPLTQEDARCRRTNGR